MPTSLVDHRRRRLLQLLVGSTAIAMSPLPAQSKALSRSALAGSLETGCLLKNDGSADTILLKSRLASSQAGQIAASTGDNRLDQALGVMLLDLCRRFQVRPGVGLFDDHKPNAFASSESRLSNTQGTVLLGRQMLNLGMQTPNGELFVMGICAHEFAHIVQQFSPYLERLTQDQATFQRLELHADFLSGYYLGLRAKELRYTPEELLTLGRNWQALGDSHYTDVDHHGTPAQRLGAIEAGYNLGRERPNFSIEGACEIGARYLET